MPLPQQWTIRTMLDWCTGYLGRHGDDAARRSAEVLLGKACGLERIGLYLDMDRPLTAAELDVIRDDVRNRAKGMPLQYITGTAPFRYLEVQVAPGVLIPRPETEVLVSEALSLIPAPPKPQDELDELLLAGYRAAMQAEGADDGGRGSAGAPERATLLVADICTGSGCIACSIAAEHPLTRVVATDISDDAVSLARRNVEHCGVSDRVDVVKGDLGECVDPALWGKLDLVVSNPPYVPSAVLAGLPIEVGGFEPALALDGGEDGLGPFRRLAAWARESLKPGGGFACELHETCLDAAEAWAVEMGFEDTRIVYDLAGRPRVLVARNAG